MRSMQSSVQPAVRWARPGPARRQRTGCLVTSPRKFRVSVGSPATGPAPLILLGRVLFFGTPYA